MNKTITKFLLGALFISLLAAPGFAGENSASTFKVTEDTKSLTEASLYLYGSARHYKEIAEWNKLQPPYHLKLGQVLVLKKAPTLTPEEGEHKLLAYWEKKLGVTPIETEAQAPTPAPAPTPAIVPEEAAPSPEIAGPPPKPPIGLDVELGVSSITLDESNIPQYSETSLLLRTTYQHALLPDSPWEYRVSGYGTIASLSQNYSNSAYFFGISANIGWVPAKISDPWKLELLPGVRYESTVVANSTFGYRNLLGPDLEVALTRQLPKRNSIKAAIFGATFTNTDTVTGDLEAGANLSFAHRLPNGHPIGLSADLTHFYLNQEPLIMDVTTFSLGVFYRF